jgi:hypothetical protein
MTAFDQYGKLYRPHDDTARVTHGTLPMGSYVIGRDQQGNWFLEKVEDFTLPPKLYGDTLKNTDRILNTFLDRPNSTGVLLAGEKGSGKTLLAKNLVIEAANRYGIPTIIINSPWAGDAFNKFIQDIHQPCLILFDEFEKVYDSESQEAMLTLLDGVFPSKKLFVLTCNDRYRIDQHMRNRPGRIFYMIDFAGLGVEFIREYCEDNLINKEYIEKVVAVSSVFSQFNFDMLKALVEEMNRYDEPPTEAIKILNAKVEYSGKNMYKVVSMKHDGELMPNVMDKEWKGNPFNESITISIKLKLEENRKPQPVAVESDDYYDDDDDDDYEWLNVQFAPRDIVRVDGGDNIIVYQKDDHELILRRFYENHKASFEDLF